MSDQASKAAEPILRFGKRDGGCNHYTLSAYSWKHWEFSDGCRGSWARTPWGAVIRWNRWRKEPARPE